MPPVSPFLFYSLTLSLFTLTLSVLFKSNTRVNSIRSFTRLFIIITTLIIPNISPLAIDSLSPIIRLGKLKVESPIILATKLNSYYTIIFNLRASLLSSNRSYILLATLLASRISATPSFFSPLKGRNYNLKLARPVLLYSTP